MKNIKIPTGIVNGKKQFINFPSSDINITEIKSKAAEKTIYRAGYDGKIPPGELGDIADEISRPNTIIYLEVKSKNIFYSEEEI